MHTSMQFVQDRKQITADFLKQFCGLPGDADMAAVKVLQQSCDNIAVRVPPYILRFPVDQGSVQSLQKEAALTPYIKNQYVTTPDLTFKTDVAYPFSIHREIPGTSLSSEIYKALSDEQKTALAGTLAHFFAHLHAIPLETARVCGASVGNPLVEVSLLKGMHAAVAPYIPKNYFDAFISKYIAFVDRAKDSVFGHFDTHNHNIAFDTELGSIVGVFDFGDARIDDRAAEFQSLNQIAPDLTARTLAAYEEDTGISVDHDAVQMCSIAYDYANMFGNLERGSPVDGPEIQGNIAELLEWHRTFGIMYV
jgi:aminoglycoside phosphotransferase (APT) family kinase protein